MPHNERFLCQECGYVSICCIGEEKTDKFSVAPMICQSCKNLANYIFAKVDEYGYRIRHTFTCKSCHLAEHLIRWQGYSCPKCNSKMRALGKSFYWQDLSQAHQYFTTEKG